MQYVKVFDNQKKAVVKLVLNADNKISYDYFQTIFPDAVGLIERDADSFIGIPFDEKKNFTWNWNDNITYDLVYKDSNNNRRSTSTTSSTSITLKDKLWGWLGVAGGLFSSTKLPDQYKKLV